MSEATAGRGTAFLIGVIATILAVAALSVASSIIAPIFFALFTIAIVWPLQRALQDRVPQLLALAITLVITIVVIGAVLSLSVWGFTRAGQWIIANAARFQELYIQKTQWLEDQGIVVAGLLADSFNVNWLVRIFQNFVLWANNLAGFAVIAFIFLLLGLLEVDIIERKLSKSGDWGIRLRNACGEIAEKFRRYMGVRTLMSVMTGLVLWAFAAVTGLEPAIAWGMIGFSLNYIPFIGPLIATVLPTLFAVVQFESWQSAVLVFAGMNLIQFLIGSYLEPRVAGSALAVSPFMVLFAVFFWSFLWGIPGAFIGVPVLIAIVTLCDEYQSSRWVAELLSGKDEA
ncbi:AI-2E family transporter [Pseudochelatococcus contaminans]|uniref:Putative PurR-regulated permease PerM n=1 Tax=Pseudochelatococcus contaminans TaxID=1538103 RepID=A0A7W5Z3M1_9HYPH|nr:AI-2E family transporter [Pseudochelatococcus contaminans]MBB3809369.1 putative PurR-regulated permease PerM [Pseudochelatococcus contaminans]